MSNLMVLKYAVNDTPHGCQRRKPISKKIWSDMRPNILIYPSEDNKRASCQGKTGCPACK
jgi:hypothetical protein